MLLFFSYLRYRCYWFLVTKTNNSRLILVYNTAVERKYVFRKRSSLYNTHGQKINYTLV